jgi:hypothetical protein
MDFESLIQLPESHRDDRWEAHFLDGLIPRKVDVEDAEPKAGPDGWPYLRIRAQAAEGGEPFARVVRWLAGRGIGLVVNAHKMMPDYVFTYGMIWNFVETGRFVNPPVPEPEPSSEAKMVAGAPTAKFLPPYVRGILREFLVNQGFPNPRVAVVTTADWRHSDLVFSTESLNGIVPSGQRTLAEALAWFLPTHYGLRFVPEAELAAFRPL